MRFLRMALLLLAALLATSSASAQGTADIDKARQLARESADLLDAKRYSEALDRATQAEALYHAPLHVAVIAESLEGLGRLAEAAAKYEQLVAEPLPKAAPQVFKDAQARGRERLRQLVARVPSLLVKVQGPPAASAAVDGKPLALDTGVAVRLDPGPHTVTVNAPGFRPFSETVTLPARGGVVVLDATLQPEAPPAPVAALPPDVRPSPPPVAPPAPAPPPPREPGRSASRLPGVIVLGVGGVGLAIGAITGQLFLAHLGDLKSVCPNDRCPAGEQPQIDTTRALGNASTTALVLGAAAVVAGAVVLVVRKGTAGAAFERSHLARLWIGPAGVAGAFR